MRADLEEQFRADGLRSADIAFRRSANARYLGQGYELRIDMPGRRCRQRRRSRARLSNSTPSIKPNMVIRLPQSPIEIVNIRLTGIAPHQPFAASRWPEAAILRGALIKNGWLLFQAHRATGADGHRLLSARTVCHPGQKIAGPAIILQTDSTTVVPPGSTLSADDGGNLIIQLQVRNERAPCLPLARSNSSIRLPRASSKARWKTSPSRWATNSCGCPIRASFVSRRTSERR